MMPPRCCFAALRCVVCHASRLPGSMAELNTSAAGKRSSRRAERCGGEVLELVVKGEASVASSEIH